MNITYLTFFFIIITFPCIGFSVPFVKYQSCADQFNCEQDRQNDSELRTYSVQVQGHGTINAPDFADESSVCSLGKQGDSTKNSVTVSVEFATLYDNQLIISNGTMVFKHISMGLPFIIGGHGESDEWHFHQREPSSVGTNRRTEARLKNKAYVSASNQTESAEQKNLWKYPSFIPYSLGLNYNSNCTMIVKNVSVSKGDVTATVASAVNRGDIRQWVITIMKYPDKGDNPPSAYVEIQFDIEYYAYPEEEEEEME